MANWTVASRFLDELLRRANDRRHLDCSPELLVNWYATAFPTEAGCQDSRSKIRNLLETLADADAISLPKGVAGWTQFPPPKLPNWVRFPAGLQQSSDERYKNFPWGPELAFLANLPSVPHFEVLVAINSWLRDGGREIVLQAPLRERSIEITGDEKLLDSVIRCQALKPEPGKGITFSLLKAFPAPPPLAYERGPRETAGKPVLVIENAHTWYSFSSWNRVAGRYAAVIYGSGKAFGASVPHLRSIITETQSAPEVRYFGDLDHAGLSIPIEAGEVAWQEGLPVPLPEEWLYQELVKFKPQPMTVSRDCQDCTIASIVGWLPASLRDVAGNILSHGGRVAQERVGAAFLKNVKIS